MEISRNTIDEFAKSSSGEEPSYSKIVVRIPITENPPNDPEQIALYGEFLYEATKHIKVGGKVIFHKRDRK